MRILISTQLQFDMLNEHVYVYELLTIVIYIVKIERAFRWSVQFAEQFRWTTISPFDNKLNDQFFMQSCSQ